MISFLNLNRYDVQWSPVDDIFAVAAGTMPAHCTLYNARADREFEFGAAHRNTISWSPHGRFLCLAGFGNLAGDMDFYDMNRRKVFGSANAHCAVQCSWSPDSRYFMTATLAPRMNVDNGFKVFKYVYLHQYSCLMFLRLIPFRTVTFSDPVQWCPAVPLACGFLPPSSPIE